MNKPIYLFYEEPDPDRWFKFDRYPRKLIRSLLGRNPSPGGVMRWFLNLRQGLDILGTNYRVNDYTALKKDPGAWACVIGKPNVIKKIPLKNRIIFGPGLSSHPYDDDFWLERENIKHLIISCEWFKEMYSRDLPRVIPITVWPSGVETDIWLPSNKKEYKNRILVYDKIRWERDRLVNEILTPIVEHIKSFGIEISYIKYGEYKENDFMSQLKDVDAMIFLCEHETQGFAYLQTLSCNVPIYAWDRGGFWQDPSLFPHKVKFDGVTSVPYWNDLCGMKFLDFLGFSKNFNVFIEKVKTNTFSPRTYILNEFTLEYRASQYLDIVKKIMTNE